MDSLGTWLVLVVVLLLPPAAVIALVLRTRRLSKASLLPRVAAWVAYALAALGALVIGAGTGSCVALETVGLRGERIDPSQKARVLGEAISELLNCSALGLLVASVGGVWVFFWALRSRRAAPGDRILRG